MISGREYLVRTIMNSDAHRILSLIAAAIFADKRVYATEIDAFLKSAQNLKALRRLVPNLSEAKLLSWYELNKEDIRGKLSTPYFKDWFYELLNALSNLPDKSSILGAMASVSEADGEIHVSERALIVLAERHWGLR